MKTNFELWVEENVYSQETKDILAEAVVCYKMSAHRASLLLSYLAFIDIIKKRIFSANKPNAVSEGEWLNRKKQLLDDDISEKTAYQMMIDSKAKFFNLSNSVVIQVQYWKDRRNDCAHLKNNNITSSYVESFWSFLMGNLNKFIIKDSGNDLLSKIKRHFDETYTPINEDVMPLIRTIPFYIEVRELPEFLQSLRNELKEVSEDSWFHFDAAAQVFYIILSKLENSYSALAKEFILSDESLMKELFEYYPEFLIYYNIEYPDLVRQLWKSYLKGVNTCRVAHVLLRNSIIPRGQIEEFLQECAYDLHDIKPREEDFAFLCTYNFDEIINEFLKSALTKSNSLEWWVKENNKFIRFYINYCFVHKWDSLIDMFLIEYENSVSDSKVEMIYKMFIEALEQKNEFMEYARERAQINNIELDDLLWLY